MKAKQTGAAACLLCFAGATIGCRSAAPAVHSLAPLSSEEIKSAAHLFKTAHSLPANAIFSTIELQEPPKDSVLRDVLAPRRAHAIVYEQAANRTFEGVADISGGRVESWNEVAGVQPPISESDVGAAASIVGADPRWHRAMKDRGINDLENVKTAVWPAGYFGPLDQASSRVVRTIFFYGGAGRNSWAHPIEGVAARVNLTEGKILEFIDSDRNAPVTRENFELPESGKAGATRRSWSSKISGIWNRPFKIENGEVRWQKWRFRFAVRPREGLVLYTVKYEDAGHVRPVLYRASLSEMVVPYGDPGPAWYFRNALDAGELGLGVTASSMRPGVDCPEACEVFDAVLADPSGEPRTIPGAVALYERDAGISWKHGEGGLRGRELVVSFFAETGNYDYGFDWIFRQDGAIELRTTLTGVMTVKALPQGAHDQHSHLVAKDLAAVHHQHFFIFRLDLDVDGAASNRVVEMNSLPAEGAANPYGGAFTMQETVLANESDAQRNLELKTSRRWIVQNVSTKNSLGQMTGYALLPGENSVSFARADSWIRKRAGFLRSHIWVTPYNESEVFAAGDYPNQSLGGEGLPKWTAANRAIDGRDIVLWYTFGVTHNPRPEDWPVMPSYTAGFKLVPWSFFSHNPLVPKH